MGAVIGGIGGLILALVFILLSKISGSEDWDMFARKGFPAFPTTLFPLFRKCPKTTCSLYNSAVRGGPNEKYGVEAYLDLFGKRVMTSNKSLLTSEEQPEGRKLAERRMATPKLVIAGKMSVEDGPCNIAQLSLENSQWSLKARIQLSLYNSYSGGEVYSLLANHTADTSMLNSLADRAK
jgi:hypothetical protein